LHHEGGNCLKIAFLVNDLPLSGGINAILKHASGLSRIHHHDVTIVVSGRGGWHEWRYPELKDVEVRPLSSALDVEFDVAVATWWETIFNVGLLNARATVWFIQSLEDRFYTAGDPMQLLAQSAYSVNVPAITEAAWIRDFLVSLNPLRPVGYAVNGIDKAVFKPSTQRLVPSAPLKIMIEGSLSAPNKGVRQCFEVLARMEEPHEVVWVSPSGASPDGPEVMALAGPLTFDPAEPNSLVIKHVLYGVIAAFLLLPGFLGVGDSREPDLRGSWWGRSLASPVVTYLGTISYGVFLWHLVLLRLIQTSLGLDVFAGGFWIVWPLVVLASIAVASTSWLILEKPILAWAHRITPGEGAAIRPASPSQASEPASTPPPVTPPPAVP
jgi:hypothetical protein